MSSQTTIAWTEATWNPVTGCTEVSPGCDHCYARTFAERFRGVSGHPYTQGFDLTCRPERLNLPLQWRKPRRIFVNSMSDLLHRDVPTTFIMQVFATMAQASWHTFQVLTKRPARLQCLAPQLLEQFDGVWPWHIWCGVSVESSAYLWRVETLRRVPCPVRFISAEPLLGPLVPGLALAGIGWVITGGESGAGHRPCESAWVREVRDLCQYEGVAFFHKQWGGRTPLVGGRLLDGRTWDEFPHRGALVADKEMNTKGEPQ